MSTNGLPIAQLAIYAIITPPVLYVTYRHGARGVLGWGYLLAFCILRLTGGALSINSSSAGASIISNIGVSPMLLSLDGILHEAKTYRYPNLNRRLDYTFIIFFHVLVATAVALVGVGAGGLASNKPEPSDLTNAKVGMALLEASWGILAIWASWALRFGSNGQRAVTASTGWEGKMLLYSIYISLVLVEVHLIYLLVAECTQRADLNPVTGALAARVVLGFLPELLAALVLVFVGLRTRGVRERAGTTTGDKRERSAVRGGWI